MHKHRSAFHCLHECWLDCVLHKHSESASNAQVVCCHRVALTVTRKHNLFHALLHVVQISGESQDSHQLARNSNVKLCLASKALLCCSLTNRNLAQEPIVRVHHSAPSESGLVDIQTSKSTNLIIIKLTWLSLCDAKLLEALDLCNSELVVRDQAPKQGLVGLGALVEHACINGSCKKIVGSSDGMNIACQMQIELFHRDHLRVPSTSSPSLDAKRWALRWLAQTGERVNPNVSTQCLCKTNSCGALALTQRSWCDASHDNVLAILAMLEAIEDRQIHLGLVLAIRIDFTGKKTNFIGQLTDQFGSLRRRNLNVAWHRPQEIELQLSESPRTRVRHCLSALERVRNHKGNSQRTNTTRNRGDEGSHVLCSCKVHVTNETAASFLGCIRDSVDAAIDHNRAWLDPISLNEVGLSNGHHQDVCRANQRRQVCCLRVRNRNGRITTKQQLRHWPANNVRSSHDNGVLASNLHPGSVNEVQAAQRCGWNQSWIARTFLGQLSRVE
eukprot:m.715111 g.715111  ORF g.715111 m.715111 type:complete len:501 (-) comp58785_c0_seq2:2202-3704(-)